MDDWEVLTARKDESDWETYSAMRKLTKKLLKEWIVRDFWSYYEAACLVTGYEPTPYLKVIPKKRFVYAVGGEMESKHIEAANKLLDIFEAADWPKYGTIRENYETDQKSYQVLLESKAVPINRLLRNALFTHESPIVDPKIIKLLTPLIDHIHQFSKSQELKTYGSKLQKGHVADWLFTQGMTKRNAAAFAPYIWRHYRSAK